MKTFTDASGRTWTLDLTIGAFRAVRDLAGVDLAQIVEKKSGLLWKLYSDPLTVVSVLWVLCMEQADRLKVPQAQWEKSLTPDVLRAAKAALLEEVSGFFSSFLPQEGKLLAEALRIMDRIAATLAEKAAADMAASVPPPSYGSPSGNAPVSAE